MAKLVNLEIKHFRSISKLVIDFSQDSSLVCFIGRGDTGKTTILDAIAAALSPSWNLTFNDTDFFKCNHKFNIEILATLVDIPEKLISQQRFGPMVRSFNLESGKINDDIINDEDSDQFVPAITVKLTVDKYLEPKWTVTNSRNQEDKPISAIERAALSCYMISDQVDRHFSWNKGNPLYTLLKNSKGDPNAEETNIVIESLRQAKARIDEHGFAELTDVTDLIKNQGASLGLDLQRIVTTLDVKDLSVRDGRISLHEDLVPLRLKGKGSKRLASLAIQLALAQNGGIVLVDEVEQGLEPDRIKQLVRALKDVVNGQIFLTTHSRDVITELGARSLNLVLADRETDRHDIRSLDTPEDTFTGLVRACPEAFFAKKVIVCEGATEIGICRALDKYRRYQGREQMAFLDCAYVDGEGTSFLERARLINENKLVTAILCDSDREDDNDVKNDLKGAGIAIYDSEAGLCLEQQIFKDLPWEGIKELISYVLITHKKNDLSAVAQSIDAKLTFKLPQDWLEQDTPDIRMAMALASIAKKSEWFKRTDHGEFLGDTVFKYLGTMKEDCRLRLILEELSNWIEG